MINRVLYPFVMEECKRCNKSECILFSFKTTEERINFIVFPDKETVQKIVEIHNQKK